VLAHVKRDFAIDLACLHVPQLTRVTVGADGTIRRVPDVDLRRDASNT
jgi:hypothetical protein